MWQDLPPREMVTTFAWYLPEDVRDRVILKLPDDSFPCRYLVAVFETEMTSLSVSFTLEAKPGEPLGYDLVRSIMRSLVETMAADAEGRWKEL